MSGFELLIIGASRSLSSRNYRCDSVACRPGQVVRWSAGGGPLPSPLHLVQSYYFGILSPAIAVLCALGATARWHQLQAIGRLDNRVTPPGMWFAVYGPAASTYVLGGARQVLPIGGFTGSVPSPPASRLTQMLARHQIAWAEIPGPGDLRFSDPRVQLINHDCIQVNPFGDMTARERLYNCRNA